MDTLELREELYPDVHKYTPSWWTVWGPYIVFAFIMLILTLSYFIKYPDMILAEAKFVSEIPSVTIPAKIDSKIIAIKKNDGAYVGKDNYIIVFQDNCNYEDVLILKGKLEKLENDTDLIAFFEDGINHEYKLGIHLQANWNNLMTYLLEYCKIVKQKKYDLEIDRLAKELTLQQKINNKYGKILSYNDKIELIMERKQNIDSLLLAGQFIGKGEYDEKLQRYLETRKGLKGEELSYERANLEIRKTINAIDQLKQVKREKLLELNVNIKNAILDMKNSINTWEDAYVIKSPIPGFLHFLSPLKENMHITTGEELVMVTPDSMKFHAILKIPFTGAGKIKDGQKVHIKLIDYPYHEFGIITGIIDKLSNVANKEYYWGNVKLDNNNITDYNKK